MTAICVAYAPLGRDESHPYIVDAHSLGRGVRQGRRFSDIRGYSLGEVNPTGRFLGESSTCCALSF
jgi:hypothetical protein